MSLFLDRETLGTITAEPGTLATPTPALGTSHPGRAARGPGFIKKAGLVGALAVTSGFAFMAAVVLAELFAPPAWRPSTRLGAFEGHVETERLLTAIEAKRAEAAALAQEQARAQQETIALQAENDRVTKAYEALYQRGNALAQEWARGATQILAMNAQARIEALKGKSEVSAKKDNLAFWCDAIGFLASRDLGCDELRGSARGDRNAMSEEIIRDYEDKARRVAVASRAWAEGLPDPAAVMADIRRVERLHPLPPAAVPPAILKDRSKT